VELSIVLLLPDADVVSPLVELPGMLLLAVVALVSAGADAVDEVLASVVLAVLLLRCAQPMPVAAAAATATSARRCVSLFMRDSFGGIDRRCSRWGRAQASYSRNRPSRQALPQQWACPASAGPARSLRLACVYKRGRVK
jgi:hypothetical protein